MSQDKENVKIITRNKRARFDYEILDKFEAGLSLQGTEVKSLRQGKSNIGDAYARFKGDELFVVGMDIPIYKEGNRANHEPLRDRKLLLHRGELNRLRQRVEQDGLTIVPLALYFKNSLVKLEIALVRGKKLYDKRQDMKDKATRREVERWT